MAGDSSCRKLLRKILLTQGSAITEQHCRSCLSSLCIFNADDRSKAIELIFQNKCTGYFFLIGANWTICESILHSLSAVIPDLLDPPRAEEVSGDEIKLLINITDAIMSMSHQKAVARIGVVILTDICCRIMNVSSLSSETIQSLIESTSRYLLMSAFFVEETGSTSFDIRDQWIRGLVMDSAESDCQKALSFRIKQDHIGAVSIRRFYQWLRDDTAAAASAINGGTMVHSEKMLEHRVPAKVRIQITKGCREGLFELYSHRHRLASLMLYLHQLKCST
jgi:hypothetical protein